MEEVPKILSAMVLQPSDHNWRIPEGERSRPCLINPDLKLGRSDEAALDVVQSAKSKGVVKMRELGKRGR